MNPTTEKDKPLLTDDLLFKYVFSHQNVLEYTVNAFLKFIGIKERFYSTTVIPQSYIMSDNKKYSAFYGDIVAVLNNEDIVILEMYRSTFTKDDYNKSYAYKCRKYINQLEKAKHIKYRDLRHVYCVNFMKGNFRRINGKLVNNYSFRNEDNNKIIDDGNTSMHLVRFDLVEKVPYNEDEDKFITLLRLINAKSIEEMKKYGKEDETMKETIEMVNRWVADSAENGLERYVEEREEEAREEGIKENRIETAKSLLRDNVAIDIIKNATKLSEKKIMSLQKSI